MRKRWLTKKKQEREVQKKRNLMLAVRKGVRWVFVVEFGTQAGGRMGGRTEGYIHTKQTGPARELHRGVLSGICAGRQRT